MIHINNKTIKSNGEKLQHKAQILLLLSCSFLTDMSRLKLKLCKDCGTCVEPQLAVQAVT